MPGGHREPGEKIGDTAKRELYEETGATKYSINLICVYSVTAPDNFDCVETFGGLYYADIEELEPELHSEIEKVYLLDELPVKLTYPLIQPKLLEEAERRGFLNKGENTSTLTLVVPNLEDLWFRERLMADEETMSYNAKWGGTIPFPKDEWEPWYEAWVRNPGAHRYYRYL